MKDAPIAAVVLAAGHGTRMKSAVPKVLHEIGHRSLLAHAMATADALNPSRLVVVVGAQAPEVGDAAKAMRADVAIAIQAPPKGTGDAVAKALPALEGFNGVVVVLYADTPLIEPATLKSLVASMTDGAGAVLGFRPFEPGAYGRLVTDEEGRLAGIVEAKDASADILAIDLCNSGVMAIEARFLREALPQLTTDNAKGEYYLTDVVAMAAKAGKRFSYVEADEDEVLGVNSRLELAVAEEIFQNRMRASAMDEGATLIDPSTVYFSADTRLGKDVVIEPGVFFGPGVAVADGATIKAYSHIEGAAVGPGSTVGPFARLRPGTTLGKGSRVGNFVETKKAEIGDGAKVNHLSYVGDAQVGARANIGAGTITCNYDGFDKYKTEIGDDAFVGSNTALVAPVKVGRGAYIGSGSVITKNVDDDSLAVARGRQADIKGWAARFRAAHSGKTK
jgi:bifunctional UDP-N-acetylglucosamine pyrophosphorylase/glucosamine-1-phosphate N-acetyltransferase